MKKLFVVKKYIMAESASEAIRKDKQTPVGDVWVHEDWMKKDIEGLFSVNEKPIGFNKKYEKNKKS